MYVLGGQTRLWAWPGLCAWCADLDEAAVSRGVVVVEAWAHEDVQVGRLDRLARPRAAHRAPVRACTPHQGHDS
jgi:hypothetical protein